MQIFFQLYIYNCLFIVFGGFANSFTPAQDEQIHLNEVAIMLGEAIWIWAVAAALFMNVYIFSFKLVSLSSPLISAPTWGYARAASLLDDLTEVYPFIFTMDINVV